MSQNLYGMPSQNYSGQSYQPNQNNQVYPSNQMNPSYQASAYPQASNSPLYRPFSAPSYPIIIGKMVDQINDIRPNEVPNDGSIAVFPQSDLNCVYVKYFTSDGLIATKKYILESPSNQNGLDESNNPSLAELASQLNRIEQTLSKLYKPHYSKKRDTRNNREVTSDVQNAK